MALTHVVDTSVLTRLARPAVRAFVQPRAEAGELARTGITDLEVGFLARSAREWDQLMGDLEIFELIESTSEHFRRARQVQRLLATKHRRGRKVPDLLIAAAAEDRSLSVLHYDANFDHIAAVTGQRCEWVVPRGSVD